MVPRRDHCNKSLSPFVKQQLIKERDPTFTHIQCRRNKRRLLLCEEVSLVALQKDPDNLEDGDLKRAVRLTNFSD